jgi:hypothetical protein
MIIMKMIFFRFWLDAGAKDNFVINETTGLISVAPDSVLDIQQNGDTYQIKVKLICQENARNQPEPYHNLS